MHLHASSHVPARLHPDLPELPPPAQPPSRTQRLAAVLLTSTAVLAAGGAAHAAAGREEQRGHVVALATLEGVALVARLVSMPAPGEPLRAPHVLDQGVALVHPSTPVQWYDRFHTTEVRPRVLELQARERARQAAEAARVAAAKLAAEKLAAEKLAAEKLAAEKLAAEKLAAEKLAAQKLAAERAAAAKAAAPRVRPQSPRPPRAARTRPAPAGSAEAVIRSIWPDHLEDRAVRVARCESGLNPRASNRGRYLGLFQLSNAIVSQYGGTREDAFDATWNTQTAYKVYQDRGWQPWSCRNA